MPAAVPDDILNLRANASLRGSAFCRALAGATDRWLASLFDAAVGTTNGDGLALVAVGGYGRAELCPGSDVDVILVDGSRRGRPGLGRTAEAIWYPVWDAGVKLGHAVRTPKEALSLAGTDLDTATALLSTRLVAGDAAVAADLAARALAQWQSRSSRWLAALSASVAERHAKAGEVAFLLEPDLKEGRGGLRDAHALGWAEAARRILLEEDHDTLGRAYEELLAARVELHRRTGKARDQLLLQEQDGVAANLGFGAPPKGADVLMGRLAAAARTIAWTSDETWQRVDASLKGPGGRVATTDQPIGPGLVLRDGLVALAPGPDAPSPAADPFLALRAAAAAADAGTRIARPTLDRLAAESSSPGPGAWPEEARRALLRLLGAGRPALAVLEAMDQKGLLVRLVPEWEQVRSLPQRNAYHRFTVDRHLCETAAEAASRAARVHRPDLLLMAAWLHDVGKGYPGDHSESGAKVVEQVATRVGFEPDDVAVLVRLTRHHLLLADAATRRDISDPATAETVAATVGDTGALELLHVLTEADSVATGPSAWSDWKAGLVAELVARTALVLAGEDGRLGVDVSGGPGATHRGLIAEAVATGDVAMRAEGREVALAGPDRPGLFCRVAGTLALHGLDVLAARVWSSEEGVAVETFRVEPVFGGEPNWAQVEADVRKVLGGRLSLEARLAERARAYARRSQPASATPAQTHVTVDNDASATASVVEVRAPDRIGTLYRITRALAELELDIRLAKVATLGHEVVDVFYVVDAAGSKLLDADHRKEVERAVLVELSRA